VRPTKKENTGIVTVVLSVFFSDILPIFLIAGIGYLLASRLQANVKTLAHVVFYALAPCLAFRMLVTSKMSGPEAGRMALLAILVLVVMGALARLAAIPLGLRGPELSAFLLVVMLSNGGNYGLPVVLFAFGERALAPATVFFVTSSILTYTVGVSVAASGTRSLFRAITGIARIPVIYGMAAAVFFSLSGIDVPLVIMRPVQLLSDAAIPIMILVLGMQLERATKPERVSVVAAAVGLSLFAAPIVSLGLTWLLGLSSAARQAGIILASMPTAVITTILALEFDVAPAFVTNVVFVTTLLSPITLAPLIVYLMTMN
jgi:malate permease and related proteins